MTTSEGRQQLRQKEAVTEAATPVVQVEEAAPMTAPPCEKKPDGSWRIRGVYHHQVLKAGLRLLNERWNTPERELVDLPKTMMRAGLFRDLLIGKIRLQSVPREELLQ